MYWTLALWGDFLQPSLDGFTIRHVTGFIGLMFIFPVYRRKAQQLAKVSFLRLLRLVIFLACPIISSTHST